MKKDISKFCILIDSREQKPYLFNNIKPLPPKTKIVGLKTGDYSLENFQDKICVERKEKSDLFNSIGKGRKRLEAEFERMSEMDYAVLLIESSLAGIFTNPPSRSKMNPKAVFRTLISWSQKYNVHVWPMWNREASERVTYLILKQFYTHTMEGKK